MVCPSCDDDFEKLEPNSDIAGIGVRIDANLFPCGMLRVSTHHVANDPVSQVTLSFLFSTSFLVIYVLIYYLAVYDPDLDPYRSVHEPHQLVEIPNPIDRTFLQLFRNVCAASLEKTRFGRKMLSGFAERRALDRASTKVRR